MVMRQFNKWMDNHLMLMNLFHHTMKWNLWLAQWFTSKEGYAMVNFTYMLFRIYTFKVWIPVLLISGVKACLYFKYKVIRKMGMILFIWTKMTTLQNKCHKSDFFNFSKLFRVLHHALHESWYWTGQSCG